MKSSETTLSLCMILRDEELNLPISLGPIHGLFDEVVVVDTGSKDRTRELARSYGAKVIEATWNDDFSKARNLSIKESSGGWLFWLDGDNRIQPDDVETIRHCLDDKGEKILWCNEVVEPSGEQLMQKRVFPNRPEVYFEGRVHEQLIHPNHYESVITPVKILHWGYADKAKAREKGERNIRLLMDMVKKQPADLYLCYQIGKTLFNLRQFEGALLWLKRAAKLQSQKHQNLGLYLHAHILKAQTLERLGLFQKAEDCLRGLIKSYPDYGPGHFYLGRFLFTQSDAKAASICFQTFLKLGANDPITGLNHSHLTFMAALLLGRCHETLNNPQDAITAYHMAAETNPANPEPSLALAKIFLSQDRPKLALNYTRRNLKLNPGNRRGAELLKQITGNAEA
ncbi:MAG: glycosyltransferase [Deltaproteobacteria bacterium]|nr:glycosyltransferase [Deltaproteobacteria bacterium]MBW2140904.1 glycosyltransferase [Deltaproteobacteria bacterium]